MTWLTGFLVIAASCWLIGLATSIVIAPRRTEVFLGSFASSARAHYTEQTLRLVAGVAITLHSRVAPVTP